MKTAIVLVGPAEDRGRHWVAIAAGSERAAPMCMTPDEARLVASQMVLWADHAERRNVEAEAQARAAEEKMEQMGERIGSLMASIIGGYDDDEPDDKVTPEQIADAERTLLEERRKRANEKQRERRARAKRRK